MNNDRIFVGGFSCVLSEAELEEGGACRAPLEEKGVTT